MASTSKTFSLLHPKLAPAFGLRSPIRPSGTFPHVWGKALYEDCRASRDQRLPFPSLRRYRHHAVAGLLCPELVVEAVAGEELVVGAFLHHAAYVHDHDAVGVADG